jgi:hypothetical protein
MITNDDYHHLVFLKILGLWFGASLYLFGREALCLKNRQEEETMELICADDSA